MVYYYYYYYSIVVLFTKFVSLYAIQNNVIKRACQCKCILFTKDINQTTAMVHYSPYSDGW